MKRQDKRRMKYLERKFLITKDLTIQEHEELIELYAEEGKSFRKSMEIFKDVLLTLLLIGFVFITIDLTR